MTGYFNGIRKKDTERRKKIEEHIINVSKAEETKYRNEKDGKKNRKRGGKKKRCNNKKGNVYVNRTAKNIGQLDDGDEDKKEVGELSDYSENSSYEYSEEEGSINEYSDEDGSEEGSDYDSEFSYYSDDEESEPED